MGEEELIQEVVHDPQADDRQVIDLSGDDENISDDMDLREGADPTSAKDLGFLDDKEEKKKEEAEPGEPGGAEGEEGEVKDAGEPEPTEAPAAKKFVDVFEEYKDDPDFKDISLDEGKKVVAELIKGRDDFDRAVQAFETDKKQIVEMSDLMEENKDLADFIWDTIERHKNGLPLLKTEDDLIDEESLTPEQKAARQRIARIEKDLADRKLKEDMNFYQNKINEIQKIHVDPDTKESLLSENDIDMIADIAIRHKTDDLAGVAKWYLADRQKYVDKALERSKAKMKEEIKADVIKEYLNMKKEDREKLIGQSGKTIKKAATPPKRRDMDDGSSMKGFLASLRKYNKSVI